MARRPLRRLGLALALLLAALWVPCAGVMASTDSCCPPGMSVSDADSAPPCHGSKPAPCASVGAAPCCDVAPASAWPTAQRECSQPTPAPVARALHVTPAPSLQPFAAAGPRATAPSPARLSVVLRN